MFLLRMDVYLQSQMVCALNSSLSFQSEAARFPFSHVHRDKVSDHVTIGSQTTEHWAVELARFPLAAGGGERSVLNILQLFLF
jgi:hypothetical protein